MRTLATTLLAATIIFTAAHGATFREQLALAEKDDDTYAQIELIRRILDKETDDELSHELVDLWMKVSDYDMAEKALKSWKNAPEGYRVGIEAEILLNRDQKRDEAIALLENYHGKTADDLDITRQLVRYYEGQRENQKIAALLASAPGVAEDAPLLLQRAAVKRGLADYDGALADFALADKVNRESADTQRAVYDRLKAALPNIKVTTAALEKNPQDFIAYITRAFWLQEAGADRNLILADTEAAHKLAPDSVAVTLLYARLACTPKKALDDFSVNLGKSDPPVESLARLLKLDQQIAQNPKDAAAFAARSFELNDTPGQYLLALKDADAAIAIDPANAPARLEKVFALIQLGRAPEAATEVLVMEKTKPPALKLARAYGYLAEADLKSYRLESAFDFATKALKAQPTAEGYKTRAAILQRLGRATEAGEDLAKAKKLEKK